MTNNSNFILNEIETLKDSLDSNEILGAYSDGVSIRLSISNGNPKDSSIPPPRVPLRTMTLKFLFPENYPKESILVELVSPTLSDIVLKKLLSIIEKEAALNIDKPQIGPCILIARKQLESNRLLTAYEEIIKIKQILSKSNSPCFKEILKGLKFSETKGLIRFNMVEAECKVKIEIEIPFGYPNYESPEVRIKSSNIAEKWQKLMIAKVHDIGRRLRVGEASLKLAEGAGGYLGGEFRLGGEKKKQIITRNINYKAKPSLLIMFEWIIDWMVSSPHESCQKCKKNIDLKDTSNISGVERLFCGHFFHYECLDKYMNTPPFKEYKKCPTCDKKIWHEDFRTPLKILQERWSAKQTKEREWDEISDFMDF